MANKTKTTTRARTTLLEVLGETPNVSETGKAACVSRNCAYALKTLELPDTGFLRLPEVLKVFPVSKTAWWRGIREGRYPASIKLGARTTAWRAEDIRDLINRLGKGDARK